MAIIKKTRGKKDFAVLGLGRFGFSLAKTLADMGNQVLAVDLDEERVQAVAGYVTQAVVADATEENAMRSIGIKNVDVAIISIGELQPSILATLMMQDLGIKFIVAKAVSDIHGKVLDKLGANRIVYPERDMGNRLAHSLISGNLVDFLELAPNYSIFEVLAKEQFFNKSLKDLDLRAKYGINIIAIKRKQGITVVPQADFQIMPGDILVAMGSNDKLTELEEYL